MTDSTSPPERSRRRVLQTLGAVTTASLTVGAASGREPRNPTGSTADDPDEVEGSTHLVPAHPGEGFRFPYFLYTPPLVSDDPRPVLVQPNNTGRTSDQFSVHRTEARDLIERGFVRQLSTELRLPALVPVFPRPTRGEVNWRHGIHALDREALRIDHGPFERVDEQLIRMVDHARSLLTDRGYPVKEGIILNGFSSSGHFVNRFTAIHPDRVRSVSAGGINGMAILPVSTAEGHELDFHLGIANLEELTGEPFDPAAFADVPQFIYMGETSSMDTLGDVDEPGNDTWGPDLARTAADVYGEDMQEDRFPYCESVYREVGADAEFRLYEGVGHRISDEMRRDDVEFHRQQLEGAYTEVRTLDVIADVVGVDPWELIGAFAAGSAAVGGAGYYLHDRRTSD